jgi:hypothetical protein
LDFRAKGAFGAELRVLIIHEVLPHNGKLKVFGGVPPKPQVDNEIAGDKWFWQIIHVSQQGVKLEALRQIRERTNEKLAGQESGSAAP